MLEPHPTKKRPLSIVGTPHSCAAKPHHLVTHIHLDTDSHTHICHHTIEPFPHLRSAQWQTAPHLRHTATYAHCSTATHPERSYANPSLHSRNSSANNAITACVSQTQTALLLAQRASLHITDFLHATVSNTMPAVAADSLPQTACSRIGQLWWDMA